MKYSIKAAVFALGAIFGTAGAADAAIIYYNGSGYELTTAAYTWTDAEAEAQSFGGHLVSINDAAEETWLQANFAIANVWIGFHQLDLSDEPAGNWIWSNGDATGYVNWDGGEPNNAGGENWAAMNWGGVGNGWNDLPDAGPGYAVTFGIIEYSNVPEPGLLGLLGLGLLGAGFARRRRTAAL